jgi:hypothetical protein
MAKFAARQGNQLCLYINLKILETYDIFIAYKQ